MKLQLPNKNYDLDMALSLEDRLIVINTILTEEVEFYNSTMTIEEYFRETWDNQGTKVCMDIIGYYLTKVEKDLSTMSTKKVLEMERGSDRHVTFTSMGYENQINVGANDPDDYEY